jgi:hypothetical protein
MQSGEESFRDGRSHVFLARATHSQGHRRPRRGGQGGGVPRDSPLASPPAFAWLGVAHVPPAAPVGGEPDPRAINAAARARSVPPAPGSHPVRAASRRAAPQATAFAQRPLPAPAFAGLFFWLSGCPAQNHLRHASGPAPGRHVTAVSRAPPPHRRHGTRRRGQATTHR